MHWRIVRLSPKPQMSERRQISLSLWQTWRSFIGFQSCSTKMTVSAPVKLRPRPPTWVVRSRTSIDGSLLKLKNSNDKWVMYKINIIKTPTMSIGEIGSRIIHILVIWKEECRTPKKRWQAKNAQLEDAWDWRVGGGRTMVESGTNRNVKHTRNTKSKIAGRHYTAWHTMQF